MESSLLAIITALVSVIASMIALIKWYLPRHDRVLHNPHLIELRAVREGIDNLNKHFVEHEDDTRKHQKELLKCLDTIERCCRSRSEEV